MKPTTNTKTICGVASHVLANSTELQPCEALGFTKEQWDAAKVMDGVRAYCDTQGIDAVQLIKTLGLQVPSYYGNKKK